MLLADIASSQSLCYMSQQSSTKPEKRIFELNDLMGVLIVRSKISDDPAIIACPYKLIKNNEKASC